MKNIITHKNKVLAVSILFTLMFVLGVTATIVSAINGFAVVLYIAVACVVIGFYGMPFAWMNFITALKYVKIVSSVVDFNITDIKALGETYQMKENLMRNTISILITNGYLEGYTISNNQVEKA